MKAGGIMAGVEIRLSGKVEVVRDGDPVALPGPRARALLVMLALSAGRTVPVDTLAHGIWGEDPPERVRGSLQTYVGRLRQAIGAEVVVTEPAGYRLDLSADAVDLLRFERLITETADAPDPDPATESARLDEALSLWAGEPFGGAPSEWIEQQLVPAISERHLQAVERRVDLDILNGDGTAHLPQLRGLIEQHPLRETLWAHLLTALDAAGRTAEALERYEALRERLADELGVDPSPDLRRVHQELLTNDAPRTQHTRPRRLPLAVSGFTGRTEQIAALDELLAEGAPLIALHGPAGVGKTTLAVHWAHSMADSFPDGHLYVNLLGYGPGEQLGELEALGYLLRTAGIGGGQIPPDVDGCSALLREALADRRMLILLDNARDTDLVRTLVAGGATTTVVTSRNQLRGLVTRDGARRVAVEPMPITDAIALLGNQLGSDGADTEPLTELADLCGRLPIALAVAAERGGRDGRPRVDELNARLRDERDRFRAFADWADDPLTDVRAVFSWSYQHLDTDASQVFRLLGLHPDPRITVGAAAALAGFEPRMTERLLDRLTESHLLTEDSPGWYEMHDLARAYAAELATGSAEETATAVRRMRSWYLHSVHNARCTHGPQRIAVPVPDPLPGTFPLIFDSTDAANDWLTTHHRTIRALLSEAAADGDNGTVARLTPSLFRYFKYNGANREAVELFTAAAECARRENDPLLEATCTYLLSHFLDYLGNVEESMAGMQAAGDLFTAVDHPAGQLGVEIALGTTYAKLGRLEEAIASLDRARRRSSVSDPTLLPIVANNLATTYLEVGRVRNAIETAREAVETATGAELVDRENLATSSVTLGEALAADLQWDAAVASLDDAVRLFAESGNVVRQILARQLRGVAHREAGGTDAARLDWTTALDLLDRLGTDEIPSHRTANTGRRDQLHELLDALPSIDPKPPKGVDP